jgi:hypothetical protein
MTEPSAALILASKIEARAWTGTEEFAFNQAEGHMIITALRAAPASDPVDSRLRHSVKYVLDHDEHLSQMAIDELTLALDDAAPVPQVREVRDAQKIAADAIRTFCSSLGVGSVAMSGDGVERIYYAGLSLESLAAAVAIALAALPSSPAPVLAEGPIPLAEKTKCGCADKCLNKSNCVFERGAGETLCEDCPPIGYPTDKTRCTPCPRRAPAPVASPPVHEAIASDPWPPTNVVAVTQSAAAISPAGLAEVLAKVQAGISELKDRENYIPHHFHLACQALTHMAKGSR